MRPRNEQWKPARPSTETAAPPVAPRSVEAVARINLERFGGEWHEVARLPGSFRCPDGTLAALGFERTGENALALVRRSLDAKGRAGSIRRGVMQRRHPHREPAQFRLRFAPGWLPLAWQRCWVIALDDDYRWAMLGDPARRNLWLLAREPRMSRELFDELKARARRMGYDLAPLVVSPLRAG